MSLHPRLSECPDLPTLRQVCLGNASLQLTEKVLSHLESCPRCPDRMDQVWSESTRGGTKRLRLAGPHSTDQTLLPALEHFGGLDTLLARTGETELDLGFLPPSANPVMLGRFGNYDLVRVIGSGGMGIVFQARDVRTGQPVALKTLKPERFANATLKARFRREIEAIQSITHPGIPPLLDQGTEDGLPYFVMPLLEGQNFRALLEETGTLPQVNCLEYLRQVLDILQVAHAKGVIHRDIKPSNLWLEKTKGGPGKVRLLDFGLALLETGNTHITCTGSPLGTPAYFSPEQAEGKIARLTPASDLFSLGAVLYEMLTGKRVFPGDTPLVILRNIAMFQIIPPDQIDKTIPPRLNRLIMSLLAKSPARRPQSAAEVLQKLNDPGLLRLPLFSRRTLLVSAGALLVPSLGYLATRSLGGARNFRLSPALSFHLPGAVSFDFGKLGDFQNDSRSSHWVDRSGEIWHLSPADMQKEKLGALNIKPVIARMGIRTLLACDDEGQVQYHNFATGVTGPVIPPVPDLPENLPVTRPDILWTGNFGHFVVSTGNRIQFIQVTEAEPKVILYKQPLSGDAAISSLLFNPSGVESLRPFAATLTHGWFAGFGFPGTQAYDRLLVSTAMDYRMATPLTSSEFAIWDQSGHLTLMDRLIEPGSKTQYTIPEVDDANGLPALLEPRVLKYGIKKNHLALLGEVGGVGHAFLFSKAANKVVARLEVNDPVELLLKGPDLWVLDRQGWLHNFPRFEDAVD